MGLILCKTKESEKPYTIRNVGQSVYSLEELCYYIYNNVYLIGGDLVEDSLIDYIGMELGEYKLAESLNNLMRRNAGIAELVVCILKYVDYYSEDEIAELRDIIDRMNSKNVLERIAARADSLLKHNCFHSAIKNYDMIVGKDLDETLPDQFYGKVHHNMGMCYAMLFQYEAAYHCYMKAYELSNNEESKKQAYVAAWLYKNQNGKDLTDIPEEDEFVVSHEVEMLMNNAVTEAGYGEINRAMQLERDGQIAEYYEAIGAILKDYEQRYKAMCK